MTQGVGALNLKETRGVGSYIFPGLPGVQKRERLCEEVMLAQRIYEQAWMWESAMRRVESGHVPSFVFVALKEVRFEPVANEMWVGMGQY